MKVLYDWLTDYTGPDIPAPTELTELLTFHAFEIEGCETVDSHTVIDVDVLPNRSSDCLSHRGIAREIASILDKPLLFDPLAQTPTLPAPDSALQIHIADPESCPRFSLVHMRNVRVSESPQWLQDRLRALGQRPVNNIVDATNYVMYALGQPLHAYDATTFPSPDGVWHVGARPARAGEQVSLLPEGGGQADRVVDLRGGELVIVDETTDQPIGLAGVKGGRYAEVTEVTTELLIEAAHFDPIRTRQTARALGIVIDASKRFENEPSRELPPYALQSVIELITNIAGGTATAWQESYPIPYEPVTVTVSVAAVNQTLGLSLSSDTVASLITRTGATVEQTDDRDILEATAPFTRTDLQLPVDYIEEVGRLYGYEHVTAVPPTAQSQATINVRQYYSDAIRHTLQAEGFDEVITSSFRKKDTVQLFNALASDKRYLRSSLTKNLHEVLDKNVGFSDLLGTSDTRVFEIGTVFSKDAAGKAVEHTTLGVGVRIGSNGYSGKEDKPLKKALAAVESRLAVAITWEIEKGVATCNLSELLETLPEPTAYETVAPAAAMQYQRFSQYPYVSRDISLWVPDATSAESVATLLNAHAGALHVRTTQFDAFTKDGHTSYGFRMVFQAFDRTLTDQEVNSYMEAVYTAVKEAGYTVR